MRPRLTPGMLWLPPFVVSLIPKGPRIREQDTKKEPQLGIVGAQPPLKNVDENVLSRYL